MSRETSGSGSAKTAFFSLQPIVTLELLGGAALPEKKTGTSIVNSDFRRLASHLKNEPILTVGNISFYLESFNHIFNLCRAVSIFLHFFYICLGEVF